MPDVMQSFVDAANAFDVEAVLFLFAPDGLIEDSSVGDVFTSHAGIRDYVEQYFVGYQTHSTVISVTAIDARNTRARVDFTGIFGHEIGYFEITTNAAGLIVSLKTYLE